MNSRAFAPFVDLRGYDRGAFRADLLASATVIFMAVPQGIAYAMIAGLPPAMGLYAAALPAVVGSLFRSSPYVVAGPTNALSLLVGGALAVEVGGADMMTVAVTLAVLVGVMQVAAGVFGLGAIVDFIASPVVFGYITGAGMLIGIGQLHHLTATAGAGGSVPHRLEVWAGGLAETNLVAVAIGLGTAAVIVGVRWVRRSWPGSLIAMALATAVSWVGDLPAYGVIRVGDLSPVPVGLPPVTLPDVGLTVALLPVAVAATVLSLVESNAVARAIAARTGQRLNSATEFFGQGMANLAAGFTGGYPVSGSLTRSVLNERAGARTRMAGALTGLMMTVVLLVLGPVVNETPIAALAGLLLVVAYDLIDATRIRVTLRAGWSDRVTFLATLLGTWVLPLDRAIYLGVGISLAFFLRQARLLTVRELTIDSAGHLHEVGPLSDDETVALRIAGVRVLQVEGRLFFGVEGDFRRAIDEAVREDSVRVLVLRLKRSQGMDVTIARVLEEAAAQLGGQGKRLILAGVPETTLEVLRRTGTLDAIGREYVFAVRGVWLQSLGEAIDRARAIAAQDRRPPTGEDDDTVPRAG